jgi:hypothetical protein
MGRDPVLPQEAGVSSYKKGALSAPMQKIKQSILELVKDAENEPK